MREFQIFIISSNNFWVSIMTKRPIVNLGELASMPGLPNEHQLRKLIRDNPDFPVIDRGAKGSAYEFDLGAVVQWLQQYQASEAEADRARGEETRQLAMVLLGSDAASGDRPVGLTSSERRAQLEEELVAGKLSARKGELMRRASLTGAIAQVVLIDSRMRAGFAQRLVANVPLAPELIAAIDTLQDLDRKAFAHDLMQVVDIAATAPAASMGGDIGR